MQPSNLRPLREAQASHPLSGNLKLPRQITEADEPGSEMWAKEILLEIKKIEAFADLGSKLTSEKVRLLRDALLTHCRGNPSLKPFLREGNKILTRIYEARRFAVAQKASQTSKSVETRQRIISAIKAASAADNPLRFADQVKNCRALWASLGPAGGQGPQLRVEFKAACEAFGNAVKRNKPR